MSDGWTGAERQSDGMNQAAVLIPVRNQPLRVDLAAGPAGERYVVVRRIWPSIYERLAHAARLTDGDRASSLRFMMAVIRWGTLEAQGLYTPNGKPFTLGFEKGIAGRVASADLVDALDVREIDLVSMAIVSSLYDAGPGREDAGEAEKKS